MATGFVIELGYNSGSLGQYASDRQAMLENIIDELKQDSDAIFGQLVLFAPDGYTAMNDVIDTNWTMRDFVDALSVKPHELPPLEKGDNGTFHISCSGGGQSRVAKEVVASAFCQLLMVRCAKAGFHVSISVV
ncbi:MAG: hypothetical protein AAF126_00350 [Chloroflexota bacterium]